MQLSFLKSQTLHYEANPAFTWLIEGRAVAPDTAQAEFDELPPPDLSCERRLSLLVRDRQSGELAALIGVLEHFLARGICHMLHGAQRLGFAPPSNFRRMCGRP